MQLAFYKGPAPELVHQISHLGTCLFTRSKYSHVELVIDGVCWSASSRDNGVRSKVIDFNSGKWDVITIAGDQAYAMEWFKEHRGEKYDWAGIFRFLIKFLPHRKDEWFCSEAVAAALCFSSPENFSPAMLEEIYR